MEKQSFFKTKAGGLTLAFIVIMIAFVLVMFGLNGDNETLYTLGFVLMILSMLYSPFKIYIIDRFQK